MPLRLLIPLATLLALPPLHAAEPDFPLTADSKPQPGIPKGTLIKGVYTAKPDSVFPGTVRDYQIYLPHGFDKAKPTPFMVFQDGVIYQAPVVFDNLIARKDIPPLVGLFVRPGVVPAAHDNALPRYNRSYEYDSVTDTYSTFLIDELLPALEKEHGLNFSTDPNDTAIAGNSSGGICAFMAAWHRPDRFRRIFTGVGTYVGIHGADRLPVLIRKIEPKPLRVFLQSGTGDNNLYCGDWWMANQMMERSLTWAGYDVNHAWGEGGHNQKHASQLFPDAMRWLWRDWQTDKVVKANVKGESKWKGFEVVAQEGKWREVGSFPLPKVDAPKDLLGSNAPQLKTTLAAASSGDVYVSLGDGRFKHLAANEKDDFSTIAEHTLVYDIAIGRDGLLHALIEYYEGGGPRLATIETNRPPAFYCENLKGEDFCISSRGHAYITSSYRQIYKDAPLGVDVVTGVKQSDRTFTEFGKPIPEGPLPDAMALSPDQTQLYFVSGHHGEVWASPLDSSGQPRLAQAFHKLDRDERGNIAPGGICVDTEGRLYVATSLGIQVCDQAGRVNFIIPTPKPPHDVCFGGKDLSELFIACGDTIYKRPTKVHGIVSGQMPPIKPAPPKL